MIGVGGLRDCYIQTDVMILYDAENPSNFPSWLKSRDLYSEVDCAIAPSHCDSSASRIVLYHHTELIWSRLENPRHTKELRTIRKM